MRGQEYSGLATDAPFREMLSEGGLGTVEQSRKELLFKTGKRSLGVQNFNASRAGKTDKIACAMSIAALCCFECPKFMVQI